MNTSNLLAQNPPPTGEPVNIYTNVSQYNFIQNTLKPSFFIRTAIFTLLGLAGVAAFLYLLWGGLQWITAGGDKDAVEKARRKIITALIGVSVVFSGYALIYIIRILFNVDVIGFNLFQLGT
jgi:hypothetical protein